MDRRLLGAWILFGLVIGGFIGGCSRSKPPEPAAVAPKQEAASHATNDAAPQEAMRAAEMAKEQAAVATAQPERAQYRGGSQFELSETPVAETLQQPGSQFNDQTPPAAPASEHGPNPFRDMPPPVAPPEASGNPLRARQDSPPIERRSGFARAIPPAPIPPVGGGAPIDDAAATTALSSDAPAPQPASATEPQSALSPTRTPTVLSPEYDLVEVFYGTDRHTAEATPSGWTHVLHYYWPTACGVFASLCVALVAMERRSLVLSLAAFAGLGVSVGLAYQDTTYAIAALRRAGKEGIQYSSERALAGKIDRGVCQVTIPRKHAAGELESPSLAHFEVFEDAARHVVLQKTERIADARFYDLLRERVTQSARRELFIFIHGFNVSFDDAARRTAQIHYDLQFDGAPIFFSWPAHDKFIFTYPADETNVNWSVPHLKQFLLEIVKESQARSINLIAHSMGNRALAAALREIELEMHDRAKLFNQVILAAPDIDADDFRNNIAPAMQRTAQRLTLYASARDDALLASQLVHHGPRAGDAGEGLVVVDGVDTIDVTAIDSSPWGHSYYGSSDPVLHDLRALFSQAMPPRDRAWLSPAQRDGLTYWIFQPARTASGSDAVNR